MSRGRRVLVIGKGGREHALAERLLVSASVSEVVVTPGNPGTAAPPAFAPGKLLRNAAGSPLEVARAIEPDLVVVGPEAPLCDGLADELTAAGFLVYGPSGAAARLEGSKAFLKDFAVQHGINTARHVTVRSEGELESALRQFEAPPVVKADGLCAGKGVVVAETHEEAARSAREMLSGRAFGDAGRALVLEERLYGVEVSAHAICDGKRAVLLPFVQDHKRLRDGDAGPNTGGMGTYGPVQMPEARLASYIQSSIIDKVLDGMARAGTPFRGTMFAGLMLIPDRDPALIEINVRFGDPETQVLTNILDGDFCELLMGAARGALDPLAEPDGETRGGHERWGRHRESVAVPGPRRKSEIELIQRLPPSAGRPHQPGCSSPGGSIPGLRGAAPPLARPDPLPTTRIPG